MGPGWVRKDTEAGQERGMAGTGADTGNKIGRRGIGREHDRKRRKGEVAQKEKKGINREEWARWHRGRRRE